MEQPNIRRTTGCSARLISRHGDSKLRLSEEFCLSALLQLLARQASFPCSGSSLESYNGQLEALGKEIAAKQ
jgi:hypothetical protein